VTQEDFRRCQKAGGMVGLSIHINGEIAQITAYEYGRYFYERDGHEYDFRASEAGWLIADELAMMLWPELKLW